MTSDLRHCIMILFCEMLPRFDGQFQRSAELIEQFILLGVQGLSVLGEHVHEKGEGFSVICPTAGAHGFGHFFVTSYLKNVILSDSEGSLLLE